MMARCIGLSVESGEQGEYPYGVVICQSDRLVAEATNRVAHERDVTRHAEVVAISQTQKALETTTLEDCTIYVNAEPCVLCSYAIRESRIGRVVYGLRSPHMGGVSKWNVLADDGLSKAIPETFAPPPEILAGFMSHEAEAALMAWNPMVWGVVKQRGLFVTGPAEAVIARDAARTGGAGNGAAAPRGVRSVWTQLVRGRRSRSRANGRRCGACSPMSQARSVQDA
jgi:tRNA(adenine34) deaminase